MPSPFGPSSENAYKVQNTQITQKLIELVVRAIGPPRFIHNFHFHPTLCDLDGFRVPTDFYLRWARIIRDNPIVAARLTQPFLDQIREVIALRTQTAREFEALAEGNPDLRESNARHRYFIRVLREVLALLEEAESEMHAASAVGVRGRWLDGAPGVALRDRDRLSLDLSGLDDLPDMGPWLDFLADFGGLDVGAKDDSSKDAGAESGGEWTVVKR